MHVHKWLLDPYLTQLSQDKHKKQLQHSYIYRHWAKACVIVAESHQHMLWALMLFATLAILHEIVHDAI